MSSSSRRRPFPSRPRSSPSQPPYRSRVTDPRETRLERALASLDGLSVGDAFGERLFLDHAAIERRETPSGRWPTTDDTEMAVAIVDVPEHYGEIDEDALTRAFAARYRLDPYRGVRPRNADRAGGHRRRSFLEGCESDRLRRRRLQGKWQRDASRSPWCVLRRRPFLGGRGGSPLGRRDPRPSRGTACTRLRGISLGNRFGYRRP